MATMIFLAEATKSIAPPIPFTILPGIFQLDMSPLSFTSMAPKTVRSTLPLRIIAKLVAESKNAEPGSVVTVCLPAFINLHPPFLQLGKAPYRASHFQTVRSHVYRLEYSLQPKLEHLSQDLRNNHL